MRITMAIVLCLVTALLVGCPKEPVTDPQTTFSGDPATPIDEATPAPAEGGRVFGVSFQTMNNPFFVDLDEGLRSVIEANGDELETLDAQWDSLKQKNDVSDLILKGCAAIFINPVNWEGNKGSLLQAQEKGIPVVIVDAPAKDADLALCTVASDNVEAGRFAAQALAEACPSAKIVVLHHSVNKACLDRVAGFTEVIGTFDDMEIIDTQEGKGTRDGGRAVMRDLVGRFPDVNAAFPINDPSALGAVSALDAAGKLEGVTIVSVDGSVEAIEAIKTGKILSTSAQFPREIGTAAAEAVYAHLAGEDVEKDIKVRVELITAENADEFLNAD